jgi:hypothetical protein
MVETVTLMAQTRTPAHSKQYMGAFTDIGKIKIRKDTFLEYMKS